MKAHCYLVRLRSYMQGCLHNHCPPLAVAPVVDAAAEVVVDAVVDERPGVGAAVIAGEAVVVFAVVAADAAGPVPGGCYAPGFALEKHRSRSCGCNRDRFRTQVSVSVKVAENAVVSGRAQEESC